MIHYVFVLLPSQCLRISDTRTKQSSAQQHNAFQTTKNCRILQLFNENAFKNIGNSPKLNAIARSLIFSLSFCLCVQFFFFNSYCDAISFDSCISTHVKDENKNISIFTESERDRKKTKEIIQRSGLTVRGIKPQYAYEHVNDQHSIVKHTKKTS